MASKPNIVGLMGSLSITGSGVGPDFYKPISDLPDRYVTTLPGQVTALVTSSTRLIADSGIYSKAFTPTKRDKNDR